jgi:hypothetical protein
LTGWHVLGFSYLEEFGHNYLIGFVSC